MLDGRAISFWQGKSVATECNGIEVLPSTMSLWHSHLVDYAWMQWYWGQLVDGQALHLVDEEHFISCRKKREKLDGQGLSFQKTMEVVPSTMSSWQSHLVDYAWMQWYWGYLVNGRALHLVDAEHFFVGGGGVLYSQG